VGSINFSTVSPKKVSVSKANKFRSKDGFKLFLLTTPFIIHTVIFSYLPLHGWIYAFFDFRVGLPLFNAPFVGFSHFTSMFDNPIVREDVIRVMRNTLAISFLGIAGSWLPMFFAIFLAEMAKSYRKIIQTLSTIPHFISWILVYSLAFAMFNVEDGFFNTILLQLGLIDSSINFLLASNNVWLTMWLYGLWKTLGWGAILYIASIAGIDAELYEAADIDGARRFQRIRYITIPCLLPTFFVLLLLSIANLINNGMEQFFVFQNPMNREHIEVLDLYVYNRGIAGINVSFATAVGVLRSIISIILLFIANYSSKLLRGESIF
jgi:putative aldouronate transport system permease protein